MDIFDPTRRSEIMGRVRSKNTKPELQLRRALHSLGFRYTLHVATLPGKPDIVLPRHGAVIEVRGCFWHGHNCPRGHPPATRLEFWGPKLAANKARDARNDRSMRKAGWRVIIVWECQLSSAAKVAKQVKRIQKLLQS